MSFAEKDRVTWKRHELPDGHGMVSKVNEVGDVKVYMVRDRTNNVFAFHEDDLELDS